MCRELLLRTAYSLMWIEGDGRAMRARCTRVLRCLGCAKEQTSLRAISMRAGWLRALHAVHIAVAERTRCARTTFLPCCAALYGIDYRICARMEFVVLFVTCVWRLYEAPGGHAARGHGGALAVPD